MTAPQRAPDRKTFGDYMRLAHEKSAFSWVRRGAPNPHKNNELLDRLRLRAPGRHVSFADDIDSLIKLQTWARHRFPTWYTRNAGDANDGPTGKQIMALLWADFLAWMEAE